MQNMYVCTYICVMKLQDALKTERFKNEQHKAILNVLYTAYWFKTHFSSVMKHEGITAEQFNVLRILKGKHPNPMCNKDIGSRMIENNSNIPRIIDRLVLKNLVERHSSKEDKRETLTQLTALGIEKLIHLNSLIDDLTNEIIGISENEALLLNQLLEKSRKTN